MPHPPITWLELVWSVTAAMAAGLAVGYFFGRTDEKNERKKAT